MAKRFYPLSVAPLPWIIPFFSIINITPLEPNNLKARAWQKGFTHSVWHLYHGSSLFFLENHPSTLYKPHPSMFHLLSPSDPPWGPLPPVEARLCSPSSAMYPLVLLSPHHLQVPEAVIASAVILVVDFLLLFQPPPTPVHPQLAMPQLFSTSSSSSRQPDEGITFRMFVPWDWLHITCGSFTPGPPI